MNKMNFLKIFCLVLVSIMLLSQYSYSFSSDDPDAPGIDGMYLG